MKHYRVYLEVFWCSFVLCVLPLISVCHFLFLSCAFNLQNPAVGQCYVVGQLLPLPLTLIMTTPGKEHFFVSHDPLILKFRFLFPSFQWCYFKTQCSFLCCLSTLEIFQAFIPSPFKSPAQMSVVWDTLCCRTLRLMRDRRLLHYMSCIVQVFAI